MASPLSLPLTLHLVITLSSLSCACAVAGFYVHPLLLPMLTSSVPWLSSALHAHLTPPILFILLHLLVVALFVTSSMMPQGKTKQENGVIIISSSKLVGTIDDGADDGCASTAFSVDASTAFSVDEGHGDDAASIDDVSNDYVLFHDAEDVSNDCVLFHDVPGDKFITDVAEDTKNSHSQHDVPADNVITDVSTEDTQKSHSQPELGSSKSTKHRTRLVRSKSDGITQQGTVERTLRPARLLKKAGTFETTWRRGRRMKPVVVVADPPELSEEGQVAEEEVDKKAEEFIGRFYQRMKLQR